MQPEVTLMNTRMEEERQRKMRKTFLILFCVGVVCVIVGSALCGAGKSKYDYSISTYRGRIRIDRSHEGYAMYVIGALLCAFGVTLVVSVIICFFLKKSSSDNGLITVSRNPTAPPMRHDPPPPYQCSQQPYQQEYPATYQTPPQHHPPTVEESDQKLLLP